jgi:MFS superfamily sulfate permease-like transporter
MPKQGLADRAEQQPGEPAVPAGADDHESGALGRLDEPPGRGGVHNADLDLDGRVLQRPGGGRVGQQLASFPVAALGAIVIWAATRLIDIREFRRIARFRRSELLLALATTAAVLAVDILYGVLIAVALSILDLLRRVARPHDGILGYAPGVAGMHDIDDYPDARTVPGLVVYRYDAPLCFANAEDFTRRALASIDLAGADAEWFVLNAEANVELDVTSADALEELRQELGRRGIVFGMARVKQDLRDELAAAGLVERIGEERIFPTLPTAVAAYVSAYTARHGVPPEGWQSVAPGSPPPG